MNSNTYVKEINNALSNIKDKIALKKAPRLDRYEYNCWGYTARTMGWIKKTRWVEDVDMQKLLNSKSIVVDESEVQEGDILVLTYNGSLAHTAVFTNVSAEGEKMFVHKPGGVGHRDCI